MSSGLTLRGELKAGFYDKPPQDIGQHAFGLEKWTIQKMKKAVIMVLGSAAMKLMKKLNSEQEVLLNISDMCIQTYAAESSILRAEKLTK